MTNVTLDFFFNVLISISHSNIFRGHFTIFKALVQAFIQKYLLGAHCVPGTALGNGDQIRSPGVYSLAEGDDKEQENK